MSWYLKEPFGAFWERGYRNLSVSCMGGPSFEVAEIAPLLPARAKVLDLGCGEGRNSLFMASLGHSVMAIDHSEAGIQKLRAIAKTSGASIHTIVGDIGSLKLEEDFDCVLAHGVLYYLDNPVWRRLLSQVKQRTMPGGFNVFTLFIYNGEYPCTDEIQAAHYKNSFQPDEIRQFYHDWHEARFDQYVKWDSHPGMPLHYHPIEKLVSQKPGTDGVKLRKEPIFGKTEMSNAQFHDIRMGMAQSDLMKFVGKPDVIDRMNAQGIQYGMSLQADDSTAPVTVDGYALELWFYGKRVVYLSNGIVSGKSLYTTQPARCRAR